jgi:hypothetical protein
MHGGHPTTHGGFVKKHRRILESMQPRPVDGVCRARRPRRCAAQDDREGVPRKTIAEADGDVFLRPRRIGNSLSTSATIFRFLLAAAAQDLASREFEAGPDPGKADVR